MSFFENLITNQILDNALMAAVLSALGAVLIKLLDVKSKKATLKLQEKSTNIQDELAIRHQILDEIEMLAERVDELTDQVDEWREKYWEQIEINNKLHAEVELLKLNINKCHCQDSGSFNPVGGKFFK